MVQMEMALISHQCENSLVPQRASDGFINATAMCKVAGKRWTDYKNNKTTTEFFAELSRSVGIPTDLLWFEQVTGPNEQRGTWVHPDVAINLGQWLSPKFAVMVSRWVREWMTGTVPHDAALPYHLARYLANRPSVPHTHFSILNELTLSLIAPLESAGYRMPDTMIPDISQGRMFAKWLRDEKGVDTDAMPTYKHYYEDGRAVDAKLYPIGLLAAFREHFHDVWMKKRCIEYFQERDKQALPHLTKMLADQVANAQQLSPPKPRFPAKQPVRRPPPRKP